MSLDIAGLTGKDNFFEDFTTGDVHEHARGKTMEMLENVLITNLVLNTAQVHFNEDAVERLGGQPHRIVFGGVTASLVIGLAMQDTGEQALEETGLDKVRFRVPVMHGDTLYAFTEVLGKNDSPEVTRGHRDAGEVNFRHYGVNQRGETVFEGERRVIVKKRAFSTFGLAYEEPETVAAVVVAEEHIVETIQPRRAAARKVKKAAPARRVVGKSAKSKPLKPIKVAAKPKAIKAQTKAVKKVAKPSSPAARPKRRAR
jgi:itaconyl-CoA hydratase